MTFIEKAVYHASKGHPAGIEALENKKTFIAFLGVLNNHMEGVRIHNENVKKQQQKHNS